MLKEIAVSQELIETYSGPTAQSYDRAANNCKMTGVSPDSAPIMVTSVGTEYEN